jgi:hypothetical protein
LVATKTNFQRIDCQRPFGYVIVTLALYNLKREIFPALTKSYFATGETFDYSLTGVSRSEPKKVIYQSEFESEIGENIASDMSDNLLCIGFDSPRRSPFVLF